MVAWVDYSGHELWDVEQEGRAPKTDADWREVERHATQLAASGPLIALGGTGQADPGWAQSPDWQKYSQELTNAGAAALDAARSKNFEALVKANGQLVEVCESCHKAFKPEVPTEGKTHQPR
jgi:cytochrome c556